MTTNQLKWAEIKEGRRHNVAGEMETVRHNLVTEGVSQQQAEAASRQAAASATQAAASMGQVGLGYANLNFQKQQWDEATKGKVLAETDQLEQKGYQYKMKGDLYGEQSTTEGYKRSNLGAQTGYYNAKTITEGVMPGYYQAKTREADSQVFTNYAKGMESGTKAVDNITNVMFKWVNFMESGGASGMMPGQYGFGWAN